MDEFTRSMRRYADRIARAHRAFMRGEISIDPLEMGDAAWEDGNGLLPLQAGYDDSTITDLPTRRRLRAAQAEAAQLPDLDLVPGWVLADVEELLEAGYELRRVATEVLPATECEDVASCEEILRDRLARRQEA